MGKRNKETALKEDEVVLQKKNTISNIKKINRSEQCNDYETTDLTPKKKKIKKAKSDTVISTAVQNEPLKIEVVQSTMEDDNSLDSSSKKKKKKKSVYQNQEQDLNIEQQKGTNNKVKKKKKNHLIEENDNNSEDTDTVVKIKNTKEPKSNDILNRNKTETYKKNKQSFQDDENDVKDEEIDQFCDEIDEEDNEQFENWVKLIEAKLQSNKKSK